MSFILCASPGVISRKRPNDYVGRSTKLALQERYSRRRVLYLLGTADFDPGHEELDRSCAAALQARIAWRAASATSSTWSSCSVRRCSSANAWRWSKASATMRQA